MEWIFRPDKRVDGGAYVEIFLWETINLPLPSSMKNVDTPSDIADCIISMRTIFQKKFSGINVTLCDLILRGECRSVSRVLINKVNEILKYLCNINQWLFFYIPR